MKPIFLCITFLFIAGCSSDNINSTDIPKSSFEIYLLADTNITEYQASQIGINWLILKYEPWLTSDDIQFYDFSSHCLYLKGDKSQFFGSNTGVNYIRGSAHGSSAFVMVAHGKRCYAGYFHSTFLSSLPSGPYISDMDFGFYPADIIHISKKSWIDSNDARNDSRIRDALTSLGLYRGGIHVELKSVQVVENSDTSMVEYVFKVTNNDEEKLYVNDPDKMKDLFHYYTNGVVLEGDRTLLQSLYREVSEPSVESDAAWFAGIPPGESIERTVKLKGYPPVPAGAYMCYFYFSSPKVQKENRSISGGRIWIGETISNTIQINVN